MIERLKALDKKTLYAIGGGVALLVFALLILLNPNIRALLGMTAKNPDAERFHEYVVTNLNHYASNLAFAAHNGRDVFDQSMTDQNKIDEAIAAAAVASWDSTVDNDTLEWVLVNVFGFGNDVVQRERAKNHPNHMTTFGFVDNLEMWDTYVEEGNRIVIFRMHAIEGDNPAGAEKDVPNLGIMYFKLTLDASERITKDLVLLREYTGRGLFGGTTVQPDASDTLPPVASISYSTGEPATEVTVTLTTNEEVVTPNGWERVTATQFTRVFTSNTQEELVVINLAGIQTTVTININNITGNATPAPTPTPTPEPVTPEPQEPTENGTE